MRFLIVLGCVSLGIIYSYSGKAKDVELPIDNEIKASIAAAEGYFHQQSCVSDAFKTSLEEYESYWKVALADSGQEGPSSCESSTVYVCRSDGSIVFEDPESACTGERSNYPPSILTPEKVVSAASAFLTEREIDVSEYRLEMLGFNYVKRTWHLRFEGSSGVLHDYYQLVVKDDSIEEITLLGR